MGFDPLLFFFFFSLVFWVWVDGFGDCGCGLVGCVDSDVIPVWIVCGLVGCVDSDVIPVWIVWVGGFVFLLGFFFFFGC